MPTQAQRIWSGKSALSFVLLFGAVNLFADMTYEGARSVTGPFLGMLGASGFVVGTVTGFGEFLGCALRLVSGRRADRSRLHWPITLGGYAVQMVSVPLLALSGSWPVPAVITLLLVFGGRASFPNAGRVEREPQASQVGRYPAAYWWYCLGAGLVGFGFADFSLISFHFSESQIVPNDWIAVFYALAMGAGGSARSSSASCSTGWAC